MKRLLIIVIACLVAPIASAQLYKYVDKDGKTDVVVAAGGKLYLWNLGKTYNVNVNPWPMFQRDLRNTGTAPLGFNCSIIK